MNPTYRRKKLMNKKLIALVLAFALAFSSFTAAFADTATAIPVDAQAAKNIGMLIGSDSGVTLDYLNGTPSRLQAAIMFLRLKGLEQTATSYTSTNNFADAADVAWAGGKNIMAYLKNNPELGWIGTGANTFNPNADIDATSYYKVMLEALGYKATITGVVGDFAYADTLAFAATKGLSKVANSTDYTVNNLATATIEALKATIKGSTKTLVASLVDAGVINAAAAVAAGLYTIPVVAALDVKSAVTVNSKVAVVTLGTAVTSVNANTIAVKDAAGNAVAVAKVQLAAWDTTGKTVVVYLVNDTTVGTLYTLTSGTKVVNFGGKAADTSKATVTGVKSDDYNKVTVTFSEAVELDGATFILAEKYGTKAVLTVSNMAYGENNNEIVLTTADQKVATLYGIEITGVKDFAGNVMDKDATFTFVGTAKSTDKLEVSSVRVVDYKTIVINFNKKVDAATVAAAGVKVDEVYGTKAAVVVANATMATADDIITPEVKEQAVVVTLGGELKASTLYKVVVSGMTTAYGVALNVDKDEATFVGMAKPTTELAMPTISVVSNTQINVKFDRNLDKATAENVANYVSAEVYGTKAALAVVKAELQSDKQTVKLTVASMKNVLYSMTVTNVKDIYNNTLKTTADANKATFVGTIVAEKITKINSIVRNNDTQITVTFDANVGATATDVAHYAIDNGVGYPEKAEFVTGAGNANKVMLTIPKTENGKILTLTVKGLENADGVLMAAEGVKATFVGKGVTSTLPAVEAAIVTDNQTVRIYFDRSVEDKTIDGVIWNSAANTLIDTKISYTGSGAAIDMEDAVEYAYQDAANSNVLIVRVNSDAFKKANAKADGTFELIGLAANFKADKNKVVFAAVDTTPTTIVIENVIATSKNSIRVYFNQAVTVETAATFAKIAKTEGNKTFAAAELVLSNPVAIDGTNAVIEFKTSADLGTSKNWIIVNPAVIASIIHDFNAPAAGYVTMKDEDAVAASIQQIREFAGTTAAAGIIKDVPVVMVDKRTIEVYYSEIMNTTGTTENVTVATNYNLVDGDGVTLKMADDSNFTAADIAEITFNATTNKATIILEKDLKASVKGYFVQFAITLENAIGNKVVKANTTTTDALKTEFAPSAVDAKKVQVASATFSGGNLVIKLNQKIANAAGYNEAAFLGDFKVTAVKTDGTVITLAASDVTSASATNTATGAVITVVVATGLKAEQVGKVEFVTAPTITGINGMTFDKDSSVVFAQ